MIGRIVEVAEDRRHLCQSRGFMVVRAIGEPEGELSRIPLDDLAAVIANAHGLSYTNNLLVALAERGVPFVLCAANHNAVGLLLPVSGNFEQARRIDAQLDAGQPLRKRLWAALVKSKLEQQAEVLALAGGADAPLRMLAKRVKSGDPENLEAQGARHYWPRLLGRDFRRDQSGDGPNALLNYGYTVLRAATARAVVAAGLHPSIGLHHSHDLNAMRLVDDLMEPFRPLVDLRVWQLIGTGAQSVDPNNKRALAAVLYADVLTDVGISPVIVCIQRLAVSLAQVFLQQRRALELPPSGACQQVGLRTPTSDVD